MECDVIFLLVQFFTSELAHLTPPVLRGRVFLPFHGAGGRPGQTRLPSMYLETSLHQNQSVCVFWCGWFTFNRHSTMSRGVLRGVGTRSQCFLATVCYWAQTSSGSAGQSPKPRDIQTCITQVMRVITEPLPPSWFVSKPSFTLVRRSRDRCRRLNQGRCCQNSRRFSMQ